VGRSVCTPLANTFLSPFWSVDVLTRHQISNCCVADYLHILCTNFYRDRPEFAETTKNILCGHFYWNTVKNNVGLLYVGYTTSHAILTCRHVVFAPSIHNSYAGATFPSVVDSLVEVSSEDSEAAWRNVEKQLSVVTFLIDAAAASLVTPSSNIQGVPE